MGAHGILLVLSRGGSKNLSFIPEFAYKTKYRPVYCNDSKILGQTSQGKQCRPRSDCSTWRNSLISVYIDCHSACIFLTHYSTVKPLSPITANISGARIFRVFTAYTHINIMNLFIYFFYQFILYVRVCCQNVCNITQKTCCCLVSRNENKVSLAY